MVGRNKFQSLSESFPEIAEEANGWDPSSISSGSGLELSWKCLLGHEWNQIVRNRTLRASAGCPTCNSILFKNPELAKEAFGWDPSKVSIKNSKKLPWKCNYGHIWEAVVYNRASGVGCPVCSGHKILKGFNDLQTTHPEIAAEADGWDPTTTTYGSNKKRSWKCSLGHKWIAATSVRSAGNNCPVCGFATVLKGFNDLKTTNPEIASQAFGWDPSNFRANSHKIKKWVCTEGHIWETAIGNRQKGTGCPVCANYGFNFSIDGYLYLLEHPIWIMQQIGITNNPKRRLKEHRKNGWVEIEIWGPVKGITAKDWESRILNFLEKQNVDLSSEKVAGKFDGYSEAWNKSKFEASSIKQLMRLTEYFERGNNLN